MDNPVDEKSPDQSRLTPLQFPEGYTPGRYTEWYCSPEHIYGPEELGAYTAAIEKLTDNATKCDSAARIWEVLQAWEMRLFRRGYHFLNAGKNGWGMYGGGSVTGNSTGAAIVQTQNAMKLFSCNVFGARHKKITSLLSREVPGTAIMPKDIADPIDQAASEEAEKYLKVFEQDADLKKAITNMASLFYTDDRVMMLTYTCADQVRWGTEVPDRQEETYGAPESDGVTPETEMQPSSGGEEGPARREVVIVGGKLEGKVPMMADDLCDMGWVRFQREASGNRLKAKYPWIAKKIAGNVGGPSQIDRLARINVRLAVQASSGSSEGYQNDSTETVTFFRPSEYEGIDDEGMRQVFYDTFPKGLEVWHAGGQLAFIRNASLSDHVTIAHPTPGDGQNREAIGANYMPLQKILNANISLLDRYFRSAIGRRYALEPYIDTQALNSQSNDPAKVTPVTGIEGKNLTIDQLTGVEQVPQPNSTIFEFIQWLIQGAPEAMDGGSPAVFGMNDGEEGTFGEARLNRDQALQVYSMPWEAICHAVCSVSQQAIQSAAENRTANINASLPGQQRMEIEIGKLKGSVLVHPESLEIPRTIAEQEQEMVALLENSNNVALYNAITNDPRNLELLAKFPSMRSFAVPGADAVEGQQGEFEILMKTGPVPNPQVEAIQEQIAKVQQQLQKGQTHPEGMTDEGQQVMQQLEQKIAQLEQAMQTLPPEISTVPVAQDSSENHAIHAAIVLGMMESPTGRKLKRGDEEQQAIYQNLHLHWSEHVQMMQQLTPPKEVEMKGSFSLGDIAKLPTPEAQSKALQAAGLQIAPEELQTQEQTHEVTEETEGINPETGVPTKRKISLVGKPLQQ